MNQITPGHDFKQAAKTPEDYLNEAKRFLFRRQYDRARRILDDGLSTFPLEAMLWMERGISIASAGRSNDPEALRSFEKAYELNPRSNKIATQLAQFLTKKGHENPALFDRAEQLYADVYHREERTVIILTALGSHYYKRNMKDMAVACFHKAMMQPGGDHIAERRFDEMERFGTPFTLHAASMLELRLDSFKTPVPMPAAPAHRHG